MLWVNKLKNDLKGVLKEHPLSVTVFFIACVIAGIHEDFYIGEILKFLFIFLFMITPCFLAVETGHFSLKELNIKKTIPYLITIIFSCVLCAGYAFLLSFKYDEAVHKKGSLYVPYTYIERLVIVYLVITIAFSIYRMYRDCGLSLEQYSVRAFLGVVKAGFLYGVLAVGSLLLIYAFNALLFDIPAETLIELTILGAVLFPGVVIGLSKVSESLGKFSKVLMGYVLPAIVAIACLIVYIYIIKIIVVRTMPSNEAFSIMTGIFVAGLFIWTTAQGCTEDPLHKYLLFFPIVFSPFIVVQIICLSMRIRQYGITSSRYLGILLIVFEIVYVAYYGVCRIKGRGVGGFLFVMLTAPFIIYYLIPGINAYSAITNSQSKVIERYLDASAKGEETSDFRSAKSALYSIKTQGSIEGMRYVEKLKGKYSQELIESINTIGYEVNYDEGVKTVIYANISNPVVKIEGYKYLKNADISIYNSETDPTKVPVYEHYDREKPLGTVNIKDMVLELKKLEEEDAGFEEKGKVLDKVIPLENGAGLYIYDLDTEVTEDGLLDSVSYSGYYLYND
ncbi:MAG: DUF4153 domain-containing protein [Butyrivibrio sp.]|nr:DUF4153 domain-containing protein [Butyrivibrio sp.]